jgi:hypothetical protein
MELAIARLVKCIFYGNKQSVLCSQQPAKGLSQMETAVFKFPPDFISQKSVFCIFTLVGTSNLTIKLLVIKKLALTSPTGGGRSVGMVRSRTKATEFSLV